MIRRKDTEYSNGNLVYIYIRNDGRKYKGYWKNGKQHGEGEFFHPKENIWKKGVWSDGRRVKWENPGPSTSQT